MERETLLAIGLGVGAVATLLIEYLAMRMAAWWDRRQHEDEKT